MKARIHVVAGPANGRVVDIDAGDTIVIGRAPDVHLSIAADSALSRRHVELSLPLDASRVKVRDLASKHGVFVNGAKVAEAELLAGDRVQIGESVLRVDIYDPVAATLAPTLVPGAPGIRCSCGALASEVGDAGSDAVFVCERCREERALAPVLPAGYELVRALGRGAMGCVFLARELATGELRAIKQVLPKAAMSAQMRKMFVREAKVQAALVHPNIVRMYDLVEPAPGNFSMLMEYVDGHSAEQLIQCGRTVAPEDAVAIGVQALDGLIHAHAKQIVHRDIKEGNLLLANGAQIVVKVADFGLAKNFHESGASGMTSDGALGGTIAYMPKEQLLDFKYVKPPADVYALGATLYRLLTGEYPRDYRDGENWILVSLEQPIVPIRSRPRGRDLPERLCAIIETALETDLGRRYKTAAEMRAALAAM